MKVVVYENKNTPGLTVQECGFDNYLDKRAAFLKAQEDIHIIGVYRGAFSLINVWWCLTRATRTFDHRPKTPEGKNRVNNF
jgi:hypothetical protein